MAGLRRISYLWKDADSAREYSTGVSLHSHTNQSKETLDFLANFGNDYSWVRKIIAFAEARARDAYQISINYAASYWTPPLTPRLAFDLESRQIEKYAQPDAAGFHHRPRQHQRAHASAHRRRRPPHSRLR